MKTRIKVVERANGDTEYFPQYQNWATWPSWHSTDPFDAYGPFLTLDKAKREIDRWLVAQAGIKEIVDGKKVKRVEYVKYP